MADSTPLLHERLKPDSIVKFTYDGGDCNKPRFVVGYWTIRGLGAPIRMMLSAAKINHWAVNYDCSEKEGGGWDMETYRTEKAWLKKEYPLTNLPFVIDTKTNTLMAQTNAILTLIGNECNMMGGSSPIEQVKCQELLCEIMDLRNKMVGFVYGGSCEVADIVSDAKNMIKQSCAHLKKLESCLSIKYKDNNNDKAKALFLVGDGLTAPDFHLYELLDQYHGLATAHDGLENVLESHPLLKQFHAGMQSLPELKDYHDSILSKFPYNNTMGRFGSDPVSKLQYQVGCGSLDSMHKMGVVEVKSSSKL